MLRLLVAVKAVLVAALVLVTVGCRTTPVPSVLAPSAPTLPNAPAEVVNREALPLCGVEQTTHNSGFDVAGRACFWNAYQARTPAEFITTQPSIEGDPITYVYRVTTDGRVVVFVDLTHDLSGPNPPPRWIRLDCPGLSLIEGSVGQPAFGPGLPNRDCEETPIS